MQFVSILVLSSVAVLASISPIRAAPACSDQFIRMEQSKLKQFCGALGVDLKQTFAWNPYNCGLPESKSDWGLAKQAVDWVFTDSGARQTYEAAMHEFASTHCIPLGSDKGMLMAILPAQAHNAKEQCRIWQCYHNINIENGYLRTLIDEGKVQEPN
jgi:hypothetical protein